MLNIQLFFLNRTTFHFNSQSHVSSSTVQKNIDLLKFKLNDVHLYERRTNTGLCSEFFEANMFLLSAPFWFLPSSGRDISLVTAANEFLCLKKPNSFT